ncbi:MAG: hypothetical protein V1739_10325 [Candidatus Omnitrophota bacterium]
MGFLEALGDAFSKLKLPQKIDIHFNLLNNINIGNKTDNSKKIELDSSKKQLTINPAALSPKEIKVIESVFHTALEEKYTFLEKDSKSLMEKFIKEDKSLDTQRILQILKPRIPADDLNIWRAALYMRTIFVAGDKELTKQLKCELMQKYGDKGRNIANLCTANYLEDFLIPAYESLKKEYAENEEVVNKKFKKLYKHIVWELPFTVFVDHGRTKKAIIAEITTKKKYGFKFINIHGIGSDNVKKIKQIIESLSSDTQYDIAEEKKEGKRIFVKVKFISSN